MHAFKYAAPQTVEDVLDLLAEAEEETVVVGGAISTTLMMKQNLLAPEVVVRLSQIEELKQIESTAEGGLRLGAGSTLYDVVHSPLVQKHFPVLAEAANLVGNVRVRAIATLGGNLAHADPAQDLPPVLMALGAVLEIRRRHESRFCPLGDFILDFMVTDLQPDELITAVLLPPPSPDLHATYMSSRRAVGTTMRRWESLVPLR
jgi:carbon-monoxide dehydrogenase medium subunit